MIESFDDNYFMRQALLQAEFALENGEVPVGAIIVTNQKIIARAFNRTEQLTDFYCTCRNAGVYFSFKLP
jgi:tRNA(adenine34) deaminase